MGVVAAFAVFGMPFIEEKEEEEIIRLRGEGSAVGLQLRARFVPAALLAMLRTALALQCVSRARDWTGHVRFCRRAPNTPQVFFTYTVHAVGYRPHTALTCLPGIFMHPHRMDDRGSVKTPVACGQPRVCYTQAKARDTSVALVAGRCLLALLASGLGSSVGAPYSTTDPLIH
jgi:hypothetical protein